MQPPALPPINLGSDGTESAEAMSAYQNPNPQAHTSPPEAVDAAQRLGQEAAQQGGFRGQ